MLAKLFLTTNQGSTVHTYSTYLFVGLVEPHLIRSWRWPDVHAA